MYSLISLFTLHYTILFKYVFKIYIHIFFVITILLDMALYQVVRFTTENDVECIPLDWLITKELCYWPPYAKQNRIIKARANNEKPTTDWNTHSIQILGKPGECNFMGQIRFTVDSIGYDIP